MGCGNALARGSDGAQEGMKSRTQREQPSGLDGKTERISCLSQHTVYCVFVPWLC